MTRAPHMRRGVAVAARAAQYLALAAALGVARPSGAQTFGAPPAGRGTTGIMAHAGVRPGVAELGEQVTYQGWVVHPGPNVYARWLPPDTSEAFTWGEPKARVTYYTPGSLGRGKTMSGKPDARGRYQIGGSHDTLWIEIPLQAFALGRLTVPGVPVEIDDGRGVRIERLPLVNLDVMPVLTAADSNADYRALHAPLAAPWWERIPWAWIATALLVLSAAWITYRLWRRRRPVAPEVAPAPVAIDPRAEALAALGALRALHLPEHARFAEHAFGLGQILRRYLEAVTGATRPGDTTPELVAHLRNAGLTADDLTRFSGLLRAWDQVKFAREPFTLEEALRAERAVEAYLRRPMVAAVKVA